MKKTRQLATILLIEDDPDVRFPIVEYLEHLGYKVVTAADGMEGLKRLRKGGYEPCDNRCCYALRERFGSGHSP